MPVMKAPSNNKTKYPVMGMESFISERISAIPEVEEVILSSEDKPINIWIIVNKLDRDVRKKFYDVRDNILKVLKGFRIEFYVVCRNDVDVNEFCSPKEATQGSAIRFFSRADSSKEDPPVFKNKVDVSSNHSK